MALRIALGNLRRRLRGVAASDSPRLYRIGGNEIMLPVGHALPEYQAAHPLYDRFLPVLARQLPPGWIIDVGANVGDTVAAVAPECSNPILAVEGHGPYADMLASNLVHLGLGERVRVERVMVGLGASPALDAARGTARASLNTLVDVESLDTLAERLPEPIALIKVDTDGFDAAVLLSGQNTIATYQPLLFWEGPSRATERRFGELHATLSRLGYEWYWVFDNFGNLMLSECPASCLNDLNNYVALMAEGGSTRTIYYVDVLATTHRTLDAARAAVGAYRAKAAIHAY